MKDEPQGFDVALRSFGLRVARLSPLLLLGFGAGTVALWAAMPEHFVFWFAQFILGMAVAPLLIKAYKTGDGMYAMLYGAVLGVATVPLTKLTLGSVGNPAALGGIVPLMAGASLVIAIMKNHLVEALDQVRAKPDSPDATADRSPEPTTER